MASIWPGTLAKTNTRNEVVQLFNTVYLPAMAVPIDFTGDVANCVAGSTSAAYADATIDMVNYYREMVGFTTDITENSANSAKSQQAALMMDAANNLSHSPAPTWPCYSADGATAAANSNLAIGASGPRAVNLYINDNNINSVGHRRWILYPRMLNMGTGSTPGANALWVLAGSIGGTRPSSPEQIAWPPAGYVPYQVVYPLWSFSLNGLSLAGADVAMHKDGAPVPLSVYPQVSSYGDPTIVWKPTGITMGEGVADQSYDVTISNVSVGETVVDLQYQVIIIDPALSNCSVQDDILDLPFTQTASTETYEACESISSLNGFEILATGDILFKAPNVVLGNGFSVAKNASFTIVSDIP